VFVRRGGDLGNHGRWWSYEVGLRLVMAWVAVLCRLGGGFVGPSTRSSGDGQILGQGGGPG
jgi:hypothetical protein